MKIAHTIAVIAAASFLTVAAAQAATDGQPTNMNGQPLLAQNADTNLMTGRSAMMMHRHHHHHVMMPHHMMHKKHMMMMHKKHMLMKKHM
jgi:hypothetical protein